MRRAKLSRGPRRKCLILAAKLLRLNWTMWSKMRSWWRSFLKTRSLKLTRRTTHGDWQCCSNSTQGKVSDLFQRNFPRKSKTHSNLVGIQVCWILTLQTHLECWKSFCFQHRVRSSTVNITQYVRRQPINTLTVNVPRVRNVENPLCAEVMRRHMPVNVSCAEPRAWRRHRWP